MFLSLRYDGQSVPDVVGRHLGNGFFQFIRGFSAILLILVGSLADEKRG